MGGHARHGDEAQASGGLKGTRGKGRETFSDAKGPHRFQTLSLVAIERDRKGGEPQMEKVEGLCFRKAFWQKHHPLVKASGEKGQESRNLAGFCVISRGGTLKNGKRDCWDPCCSRKRVTNRWESMPD